MFQVSRRFHSSHSHTDSATHDDDRSFGLSTPTHSKGFVHLFIHFCIRYWDLQTCCSTDWSKWMHLLAGFLHLLCDVVVIWQSAWMIHLSCKIIVARVWLHRMSWCVVFSCPRHFRLSDYHLFILGCCRYFVYDVWLSVKKYARNNIVTPVIEHSSDKYAAQ